MKKSWLTTITGDYRFVLILFILLAVVASLQAYFLGGKTYLENPHLYTHYNNYVIFKMSFFHLLQGKDLYIHYPAEQWDLYKYSPAFALFFGLLAWLPDILGLTIWNLLNAFLVFLAFRALSGFDTRQKVLMLLLVAIELMTSMQNSQSNGLMAGLIILSFALLQKEHFLWATLCIVATVYIKLFGVVAMALFLFYPHKGKIALYTMLWMVLFAILPIVITGPNQLIFLYKSWGHMLAHDHSISYGFSVMGWLKSWFHLNINKNLVLLLGTILFCIPLSRIKLYRDYNFRLLLLASILIWVVIFNHKAESPTFIIAMSGIVIWFFSQKHSKTNLVILLTAFILTSLTSTDLFPHVLRESLIKPYVIKAIPAIFIWFLIIYEMTFKKYRPVFVSRSAPGK